MAEADCTTDEGRALCEEVGVQGYPSLKYGNPTDLDNYEGSRSLDDLQAFTEENLKSIALNKTLKYTNNNKLVKKIVIVPNKLINIRNRNR